MCGIFCSIRSHSTTATTTESTDTHTHTTYLSDFAAMSTRLKAANALRGPDAQSSYAFSANDEATVDIELFGAELRLRGKRPVVQPHVLDGDVLCWNDIRWRVRGKPRGE